MTRKSQEIGGIRVTADLRLQTPQGEVRLTPEGAFDVARRLIRRGARRIVDEEISRSGSPRRGTR
jgi:hypothetical protein